MLKHSTWVAVSPPSPSKLPFAFVFSSTIISSVTIATIKTHFSDFLWVRHLARKLEALDTWLLASTDNGENKTRHVNRYSQSWLHIWILLQKNVLPPEKNSIKSWKGHSSERNGLVTRFTQFTKLSELSVKKVPEEHWKVLWKLKPGEVVTCSALEPEARGESQWGLHPASRHPLLLHSLRFCSHFSWALVNIRFLSFFLSLPAFISQRSKNLGHRSWHWISAQ